ncbi:MAG: hypothetical protein M3Q22_06695, partial [Actinomycetota bacterium]|nr:hypothetical protein [Actinomycetota bacterium]
AREHARAAPPKGLIPLTLNEIRRLLTRLLARPAQDLTHLLHGRSGDADTKPPPATATTDAATQPHDHNLRLEY